MEESKEVKPGVKSTEFWLVIAVVIFAIAVTAGWLTPEAITTAAERVSESSETVPVLTDALTDLIKKLGPLLVAGGSVWAYLKRRFDLKK